MIKSRKINSLLNNLPKKLQTLRRPHLQEITLRSQRNPRMIKRSRLSSRRPILPLLQTLLLKPIRQSRKRRSKRKKLSKPKKKSNQSLSRINRPKNRRSTKNINPKTGTIPSLMLRRNSRRRSQRLNLKLQSNSVTSKRTYRKRKTKFLRNIKNLLRTPRKNFKMQRKK